jgi:hypothetical protein
MIAPHVLCSAAGSAATATMRVRKRSGAYEQVDVDKIIRAVGRCARRVSAYQVAVTGTVGFDEEF